MVQPARDDGRSARTRARDGRCAVRGQPVSSLSGDLACFQPAEVLQLLQLAQATGRLVLEREGETAEVWFERGRLAGARTSRGGVRTGEILVHRGLAPRALLDEALAAQSHA